MFVIPVDFWDEDLVKEINEVLVEPSRVKMYAKIGKGICVRCEVTGIHSTVAFPTTSQQMFVVHLSVCLSVHFCQFACSFSLCYCLHRNIILPLVVS